MPNCRSCGKNFAEGKLLSVHTNMDDCSACDFGEEELGHTMDWICQHCYDDEENAELTRETLQRDIGRGNGDLSDDSDDDEEQ